MTQAQQDVEEIEIIDIEKKLQELWKGHQESGSIRASLFTLILYTHSERRTKYFKQWLDQVIEKFPCRIIFIEKKEAPGKKILKTKVTLEASEDGDNKAVCDQIWIEATQDQLEKVPFILLPHLLPDLPILLLWSQNPSETDNIFPSLSRYATRVIFDSDDSESIKDFGQQVLDQMCVTNCNIADLNWARLKIWREAIYHVFCRPELLKIFEENTTTEIVYNAPKVSDSPNPDLLAIYLQGWIAGRLGWKNGTLSKKKEETLLTFKNDNAEAKVHIRPGSHADLPPGALMSYCIKTDNHAVCLRRHNGDRMLDIEVSTPSYCALPYQVILSDLSRGHALVKEMLFGCQGDHYYSMLKTLSTIQWENHVN